MFKVMLSVITATLISALPFAAFAQSENPFLGTWDIDIQESDFGSAPVPKSITRSYADLGNRNYLYLVVTTNQAGEVSASSASYSYNGEKYPIASLDQLPTARISYRKINETTVEYTVTLDNEVQQIGAKFIAPNYQRLTIAIQYPGSEQQDQILVFNRRQ